MARAETDGIKLGKSQNLTNLQASEWKCTDAKRGFENLILV
jgi:hypothetical protein